MANEEHLAILKQGVEVWNEWRKKNIYVTPDLSGANLSGADLREANLSKTDLIWTKFFKANLSKADLHGASLREANLSKADLSLANLGAAMLQEANLNGAELYTATLFMADLNEANLSAAMLQGANLGGANLSGANLQGADLGGANLSGANLQGADLTSAVLGSFLSFSTVLGDVDLSTVNGLETVKHEGPSTIGIDTIYRSQGKIPEVFLRGAGVPDSFITYMHSLTGEAIQYYTCFISYSTKDQDFATRLHADLQAKGVRCWFAPHDIQGGKKVHEQLEQAVWVYDKLVLVLSETSIQSKWVMFELRKARRQEVAEQRRKLFPLRLVEMNTLQNWKCFDAETVTDLADEVREYFIPDFSQWKDDDAYQKAFDRLLRDLKATA